MKKTKVVCIGEALIDRIKNKKNQGFTDYLGGAPANVVCALRKLQIDSAFIGRIGNCLLYTSPSPRDGLLSRMPSSA